MMKNCVLKEMKKEIMTYVKCIETKVMKGGRGVISFVLLIWLFVVDFS